MIHRRHFLRAATFLSVAPTLSVAADEVLAQQMSGKATVKLSELNPIVREYVDQLSQEFKEHNGVELSPVEKSEMVEATISRMKDERFYAYVDP